MKKMKWERSDLQAAKLLQKLFAKTEFNIRGLDLVNTTLSFQWFDRFVKHIEDEINKPEEKPIKKSKKK